MKRLLAKNDEIQDKIEKSEMDIDVCASFFAELESQSILENVPMNSKNDDQSNISSLKIIDTTLSSPHALVVDDEDMNVFALQEMLRACKYESDAAYSREKAIELVKKRIEMVKRG